MPEKEHSPLNLDLKLKTKIGKKHYQIKNSKFKSRAIWTIDQQSESGNKIRFVWLI